MSQPLLIVDKINKRKIKMIRTLLAVVLAISTFIFQLFTDRTDITWIISIIAMIICFLLLKTVKEREDI